jgi:PHD/YefM family antitoxin component YafN of YafNO toxin-antitoxin module
MERIISITDLVRNAAKISEEIEAFGTIYRVTRGGRGSMVLVSDEYFEGWMHALDEMSRPDWQEVRARAQRDIAAGRGRSLDAIAKELGLEDPPHARRRTAASRPARRPRAKNR